jgi:hypothetical protein
LKSHVFAEQLSPILIFTQHQLRKQVIQRASNHVTLQLINKQKGKSSDPLRQPHFELLKNKLGHEVTAEDLIHHSFTVIVDPSNIKPLNLGVRLDPRVHDIYDGMPNGCSHAWFCNLFSSNLALKVAIEQNN